MIRFLITGVFFTLLSCSFVDNDHHNIDQQEDNQTFSPYGKHKLYWSWKSDFKDTTKSKLKSWISETVDATTQTLGYYPFDIHFYFYLSDNKQQAVNFGHTRRKDEQAVHLYIRPDYKQEDFLSDWKAPHEISHLSLPFVGDKNSWFAEGYATYMSRKIMMAMGYFTPTEFDSIYRENIIDTKSVYNSSTSTFIEVSDSLLSQHNFSKMYWGSTSFFYTANQQLKQMGRLSLVEVIRKYQDCCRLQDETLADVIHSFDEISKSTIFSDLLNDYQTKSSQETMKKF